MKIIKGKYATATIFTDNIEQAAIEQVTDLTNAKVAEGQRIAIMPDVHAGKGSTIGTVMTVGDRIVPNQIGVDIGCGVYAYELSVKSLDLDFEKLQRVINENVPSGRRVHKIIEGKVRENWAEVLKHIRAPLNGKEEYLRASLGTLGGGNHFISIEVGKLGQTYLLIHSGSRHLGILIAKHYQDLAKEKSLKDQDESKIIAELKAEGREKEIANTLKTFRELNLLATPEHSDLAYLEEQDAEDYLHDMEIAQAYAHDNRVLMAKAIMSGMGWKCDEVIESIHNYIDVDQKILRKGAVAAYRHERFLVPLNMKDGTLIFTVDKEQPDWLFSAPHGAGRTMSRRKAKETLDMANFSKEMEGIWSESVLEETLDEAPAAYKPAAEIEEILSGVYTLVDHLKPVFNFKSKE